MLRIAINNQQSHGALTDEDKVNDAKQNPPCEPKGNIGGAGIVSFHSIKTADHHLDSGFYRSDNFSPYMARNLPSLMHLSQNSFEPFRNASFGR